MARPKKYKIKLTDDELKELKSVIRKKNIQNNPMQMPDYY